jgi:hypothetical protein
MEGAMASLAELIESLRVQGKVSADDVIAVRQLVFGGDVAVSSDEAEALIRLDETVESPSPEWRACFLEALTDYVVRQQQPSGYVDEAKAAWLLDRVTQDGTVRTATELELLVRVLEAADSAPASLSAQVIEQVRRAVLAEETGIDAADVGFLRRVVFAVGGDGGIGVSTAEAEALFALNDTVRGRANDPAWTDLFAKSVGNAILGAAGYVAPPRAEALRQQAWLAERPKGGIIEFGRRMAASVGRRGAANPQDISDLQDERNAAYERELAVSEHVTKDEAQRLLDRIGRDGAFDDTEKALLRFLQAEAVDVHPALKDLLDRAA